VSPDISGVGRESIVTTIDKLFIFPLISVTVQITGVIPVNIWPAKVLVVLILLLILKIPQLSVIEIESGSNSLPIVTYWWGFVAFDAQRTWFPIEVIVGFWLSITVIVWLQLSEIFPALSVAVHVIVVFPTG